MGGRGIGEQVELDAMKEKDMSATTRRRPHTFDILTF